MEHALRHWLAAAGEQLPEPVLARAMLSLSVDERMTLDEHWPTWAHDGQQEPPGDWRVWLMMAGRGFGKTRAGAEWVSTRARALPGARIALVGATLDEVAQVMVHGQSGLIAVARTGEAPVWRPSARELVWPNGAAAFAYSGARPDKLRGPEHHFAWCDELAKWQSAGPSWDNLMLGLRLGPRPRAVVTTTPRPITALTAIIGDERTEVTRGRTTDNPHLPEDYRTAMVRMYGGTRIGRQELEGVLLDEAAGSLWPRDLIERCRAPLDFARDERRLARIVVGVDPPASAGGTCGIVVCGVASDGPSTSSGGATGYVLADHSVGGLSPEGWARKVAAAAAMWGAHRVVAEKNNGGAMVESVLRGAEAGLPVTLVHAAEGKAARAEPVAVLFEGGRAKFAGVFPELEDELAALSCAGGYEGPGRSPDRADAMVWAMTELMVKPQRAPPRVRVL